MSTRDAQSYWVGHWGLDFLPLLLLGWHLRLLGLFDSLGVPQVGKNWNHLQLEKCFLSRAEIKPWDRIKSQGNAPHNVRVSNTGAAGMCPNLLAVSNNPQQNKQDVNKKDLKRKTQFVFRVILWAENMDILT